MGYPASFCKLDFLRPLLSMLILMLFLIYKHEQLDEASIPEIEKYIRDLS